MSKVFEVAFQLGAELTNSFKSTFKEAGGTMKMLGGVAAALGGSAALGAMVSQVAEMDESLAKLSAQTGTFGDEMEALGDVAKNVFRSGYGESFDEVSEAIANVKQNMHNLDNGELERMTSDAMMFADTFDSDINEITRAAQNMMENFGVSSTTSMDLFATGMQRGLNFSDEMLDNVAEYAPLFSAMGYSAEEYFGIMERGAKAGVYNLDYVNDVMKEFQIRVKDGSKATGEAMGGLSKDTQKVWKEFLKGNGTVSDVASTVVGELKGMEDQIEANQIAVSLFGTKWEDLEADAMYAMLGTTDAMEDFEGSMQKINEVRFDTFGKAIEGIKRILFMDIVVPIGEALLPILNDLANYLQKNLPNAINTTTKILKTIAPVVLGLVGAFATYRAILATTAAVQTAYAAILKLGPTLLYAFRTATLAYTFAGGGMVGVIAALKSGIAALNLTVLANPFVLAAAAVVGLTIAFVTAYKTSERFRNIVDNVFATVKSTIMDAVNYITTIAPRMWNGFIDSLKDMKIRLSEEMRTIGSKAMDFFGEGITSKVSSVVSGFIDNFKTAFSSLPGIISMVAPTIATLGLGFLGVSGPIGWLIGAIISIGGFLFRLSKTNEGVASAMSSAWQSLKEAFAPVLDVFIQGFSDFATQVGPQLEQTMGIISESVVALGPSFAELGGTLVELGTLLIGMWMEVGSTIATDILPLLLQVFQTVFPLIMSVITQVVPLIIQTLMSIVPIVLQLAQMVIPLILQVVQMVFPMILTIIQSVLPIAATLITTVVGVILMLAQTVLPLILSVVQMVFPIILSVIQAIIPIITMALQTLVTVINGVVVPAINAILAVVQIVFPYVQMIIENALSIINGIIQTAMALLQGDWDGAWNAIKTTAETIMTNIISFFQGINLFEVGKSIITGLIDGIASMGSAVVTAISGLIPEPIRGAASKLLGALPGFAEGGIVASPTIAWIGEGGDTESVIPWNNSQRSKDLWVQTGQAIGMLGQDEKNESPITQAMTVTKDSINNVPVTNNVINMMDYAQKMPTINVPETPDVAVNVAPAEIIQMTEYVAQRQNDIPDIHNDIQTPPAEIIDLTKYIAAQPQLDVPTVNEQQDYIGGDIQPNQVVPQSNSGTVIHLQYSPQYNVENAEDLKQVKQHANNDKDDLEARIAELMRNERRVSFGD